VVSWTNEGDVASGVIRGELDLISAEQLIDVMLAAASSGSRRIDLDVTGVTRSRTVAGELLRAIGRHLAEQGVEVVIDGDLR
jgi:anti-anti-sigma regulatory factor